MRIDPPKAEPEVSVPATSSEAERLAWWGCKIPLAMYKEFCAAHLSLKEEQTNE